MNFAALGRLGILVISFGIHVVKIFSSLLNILMLFTDKAMWNSVHQCEWKQDLAPC